MAERADLDAAQGEDFGSAVQGVTAVVRIPRPPRLRDAAEVSK
jgi:hypothetical protein